MQLQDVLQENEADTGLWEEAAAELHGEQTPLNPYDERAEDRQAQAAFGAPDRRATWMPLLVAGATPCC